VMSGPSAVLWVGGLIALAALGFAGSGVGALPNRLYGPAARCKPKVMI
jgi:hypothetical protein